jgi:hypothetical protein
MDMLTVAETAFISPELSEKIRVLRKSSFVFENEYDIWWYI